MKFMLMLYADEKMGAQIPPEQMGKAMASLGAYRAALEKADAFVMTKPLSPTSEARTIRIEGGEVIETTGGYENRGGELRVHDGPYADTREQFGGFFMIDVADMDEALKWAARCPAAQWGPIEVRAIVEGYD